MKYEFCEFPVRIECRDTETKQDFRTISQAGVSCDVNRGLVCEDKGQSGGKCKDYEIRLYCVDACSSTIIPTGQATGTPTLTPPNKVTGAPTLTPPGQGTGSPTLTPPGQATGTPTLTPPGQGTGTPTLTPPGQTTGTPTLTPPGQGTGTPTLTPPGQATGTPTLTPPGQGTGTPTLTPPGQATGTPTLTPPGQATGTPTLTPPGQGTGTPTLTPPGGATDTPTITPPGQATGKPTLTPPGQATGTPTLTPPGQGTGTPTLTPPGQGTGSPTLTPLGQATGTPTLTPPGQATGTPTLTPPGQGTGTPTLTPPGQATGTPTLTPPGQGTGTPTLTPPGQATGTPSMTPPGQATGSPTLTPPGQATGTPTLTPPGQGTGTPTLTPPGQATGKPTLTPPGQATGTPTLTPPGQGTGTPTLTPPGQATGTPTLTPPGQATGTPTLTPPGQGTGTPTLTPPGGATGTATITPPGHATGKPTLTPPGQATGTPTLIPPGQGTGTPTLTPPGQGTGSPTLTPPGQATGTPTLTPPGQATGTPTLTPPGQGTGTPTLTPPGQATGTPTLTPPGQGTGTPTLTPPGQATGTPTLTPPGQATGSPTLTPPGQATGTPTMTPPGQGTGTPTLTPPGQATGKPTLTPPGQATGTPTLTPPGQGTGTPTLTPPGQATGTPTLTPPGQATGTPTLTPPGQGTGTPTLTPPGQATGTPTLTPPGQGTGTPTLTPPGQATGTPTLTPPGQATGSPTLTPPGQATGTPTLTPPGQGTGTPTVTPPGQATGKPTLTPPGQATGTPTLTPPGQGTGTPTLTPPGQATGTPTLTPPGQATGTPTLTPPGQGTGTPTLTPPGGATGTATITPPGQATGTPTLTPPGQATGTPTLTPPGQGTGTPTFIPSSTRSTLEPSMICKEGWTDWINFGNPAKSEGDFETYNSIPGYPNTCEEVVAAECQIASTGQNYMYSGQDVSCSPEGLVCEDGPLQKCVDYKIKFFCSCHTEMTTPSVTTIVKPPPGMDNGVPTMTPPSVTGVPGKTGIYNCTQGWTSAMSVTTSSITGDDLETITDLRRKYEFCDDEKIVSIRCADLISDKTAKELGQKVTCDMTQGLICKGADQPGGKCADYMVQLYCDCDASMTTTTLVPPMLPGGTPELRPPYHEQVTPTLKPTSHPGETTVTPRKSCDIPLGVTDRQIVSDSQLSASTSFNFTFEATNGRLMQQPSGTNGGAWMPRFFDTQQFIQVDFGHPEKISGVVTQGRQDTDQWVESFLIETSLDGIHWYKYVDRGSKKAFTIFPANFDRNTPVKSFFDREVDAQYVRIVPMTWNDKIAIRFDVLSCYGRSTTPPPGHYTTDRPTVTTPTSDGYTFTAYSEKDGGLPKHINHGPAHDYPDSGTTYSAIRLPQHDNNTYCSSNTDSPRPTDPHPYVQIDFLEPKTLSGVLTQGSPYKSEWVTSYQVYTSLNGKTWTPYSDIVNATTPKTFKGNKDNTTAVTNLFNRNINGRFIRIYPTSFHTAATLMFEILGCNPSEAVNMTTTVSPSGVSTLTPTVSPPAGSKNTPTITPPSQTGTPTTLGFGQTVPITTPTYVAPPTVCLTPMGLEYSRTVFDRQITSSSKMNELTGATQGRIHSNSSWIPSLNDSSPWIQVNFEKPKLLSGILTQGENGGQRWVTKYTVDFSMDGKTFYPYTLILGGSKSVVFSGNNDSNSLVRQLFNRNVTAQYIRIHPKEWHGNAAAIRFNIIGCNPDSPQTPIVTTPSPSVTPPTNGTVCTVPMGVANTLVVKDQQLSASSSKDMFSGAERSRLDAQKDGSFYGGWVAGENNMKQYIQVDFLAPYYVGGIKTEGRSDKDQWVTKYEIYYSTDGKHYSALPKSYLDSSPMAFSGNKDSGTPVTNLFNLVAARWIRIHPIEWNNAIAMRFEVLGCMSPSRSRLTTTALPTTPTTHMSVTGTLTSGTGTATGTTSASSVSPTACAYWTPWVSASKPDKEGEYESAWQLKQLITFCDYQYVQQTECRTTGTHIPYDQTGENGVICNNDLKGLLCYAKNQTDGSCLDYEIRVFCDECASTPAVTTAAPKTCNPRWLPWINTMTPTNEMSYVEHEFMSLQKQQELCFDGKITRIECQTIYGVSFHSAGTIGSTCEILSGLTCKNSDNYPVPCDDYQVRYYCDCAPAPTLHPTGFATGTPTITPPGYTGTGTPTQTTGGNNNGTPTLTPPGYTGTGTPTITPPGYTGTGTPTQKPGGNNNGTPTLTPPGYTGTGTPTITPPGYTGTGTPTQKPGGNNNGTPTLTPPGYTGTGTPTITPPGYTGTGTPTITPPGYTGTGTPTVTPPGYTGTGTPTITPPGYTGTGTPTITPPDYTGTGTPTITPPGYTGTGTPTITPPGYTGTGTPTITPPGYTGTGTPTITPPGYTGTGTPTMTPPGYTGTGTPTITPPGYTGTGTPTITPPGYTGTGTPTITPPGYTGTGTPTITPPGYNGTGTPTITPPGYTGTGTPTITPPGYNRTGTPTITPPGYTGTGTPTITPPGYTGTGTPTITPPGYTGTGTPTITPPGYTGTGTPTITPPGNTGTGTPTITPPGYTGTGTPTITPPGYTGTGTPTITPPGYTGTGTPTITPPGYTGTGTPTITPPGYTGTGTPTITPPGNNGTGTPTITPPGYTGTGTPTQKPGGNDNGTPTLTPPGYTGTGIPTITPPGYTGTGTPTITPPGYTGTGTPTITPPGYTGTGTPTITPPGYTGTGTPTITPPGYTGTGSPTITPPGYTGTGTPTITPPGYTGTGTPTQKPGGNNNGTPTLTPPGYTGTGTPTITPPGFTGTGSPTGYSGTGVPTVSPTGHSGGTPTLTPTTCAIATKWSSWVNRHTPDATTDEIESMTAAEKITFCGLGKIIAVECKTIDNIPSYSAGDFGFKCDIANGATCVAMDNFPIGCQDYMIRYQCQEQICGEPTTTSQTTDGTGTGTFSPMVPGQNTPTLTPPGGSTATPTAVPTTVCATTTHWSSWLNRDKPTTGGGDKEVMTGEEKQKFCPSGTIATVECASIDGVPSYQSMDIVDCNPVTGLFCDNSVNMGMCADYMIRYQCEKTTCTGPTLPPTTQSQSTLTPPRFSRTTTSPGQGGKLTTYTHKGTMHTGTVSTFETPKFASSTAHPNTSGNQTPTKSPSLICETKKRWSMWIDRSTPGINATGDHEYMTTTELQRFCARGAISGVECQTFDGHNFDQTPDYVTCTSEHGLVCDGAENFPITCINYRMRYECTEQICQTPTALPTSASGTPTVHPPSVTDGVPTVRPPGSYTGTPTLQPPGVTDEPTARPPNATGGVPTVTPKGLYTSTPTMQPTGVSGEPTAHPQNASGGVPTVTPKGSNTGTPTMHPTGVSGEPTAHPQNASGGVPTVTPKGSDTGTPTMHPTGVSGEPTAHPPNASSGVPTVTPKGSNTGTPTMHPTGVSGEPTALPPNASGGVPTVTPKGSNTGTPTMHPTGVSGEPTGHPPNASGGVPTVTPKGSNTGTPTMHPTGVSGEPTAHPPNASGGVPTVTPKGSDSGTPTMHPTGVSGEPTAHPQNASGGVPSITPKGSYTGTPTMHPPGVSGEPTAHPSTGRTGIPTVNRCTQSHWSPWINRDNPNIGGGDYENMTDNEKADFCIGGTIKSIECVTTDGIASYSSGEIMTCTLLNGFSCNSQDNAPIQCSDYKIRYFCQCEETVSTASVKPTPTISFNGTLAPTLHLTCGWSPWLNGDRPNFGSADSGDLETIASLKTKFGLCKNIVDISCRVAGTDTLADAAGQTEVLCDSVNGLRCYNRDQLGGMCYDYEVSVLCWAPECSGPVNPTMVSGAILTTAVCPPGEVWESCAHNCSDLCEGYAQSTGLCNSENPCVPMCRNPVTKHKCAPGELLKDKDTCVAKQMCPCIKPDGSVAQGYETWPSPTDNCSLCQCSNNEIKCTKYDNCSAIPQATTTTLIPPMLNGSIPTLRPIITHPDCGWTAWINSDRPSYATTVSPNPGSGVTPTLHPPGASTDLPTQKPNGNDNGTPTQQPTGVSGGTPTKHPKNTTDVQPTLSPHTNSGVTPTLSPTAPSGGLPTAGPVLCGWTTWMDGHKPDPFTGESETFSELRTTYKFCQDTDIQGIECRVKDTHAMINQTDQVNFICDIASGGLMCFGFDQPTGQCLDYEIRLFCEPAGQVCSGTPTMKPTGNAGETPTITPPGAATGTPTLFPPTGSGLTPTVTPPEHTGGSPTSKPGGNDGGTPTGHPPGMSTNLPTAHPPSKCVEKWSQWINRDKQPDGREHEYMNSTEKNSFCVGGRVSGIECKTIDNIASYSSGEILECSMENGLICEDAVNAPMPCSDYQVRYYCECPVACREKMGMESGHILTNMITVSSSRDGNLNPASSRLNSHGAWTPNHNDQKQYIQVNFLKPMLLTGIITQGRENSGSYVISYKVLFSKDGFTWSPYQDLGQDKNFTGNNNSGSKATNWFDHPIRAQYIRVVPLTWQGVIAMRMEVLGCYEGYPMNSVGPTQPGIVTQKHVTGTVNSRVLRCFEGLDVSACPKDGCADGLYCDGRQCVTKDKCPCLVDGQILMSGGFKERSNCETCQCIAGESWTAAQKAAFCPNGKVSRIECMTSDGIASYSSGEIMQCTIEGGAALRRGIRLEYLEAYRQLLHLAEGHRLQTMSWTAAQKAAFCPFGKVSRIECKTVDDIASYSSGEIMQCTIEGGAVCLNNDNFPVPCSDYKIKYYCECTVTPTMHPTGISGGVPTVTPPSGKTQNPNLVHGSTTSLQGQVTTGAPVQCYGNWSSWINTDTPDSGDGDRESWTAAQKAAFCPYGKISRIECRTTDDIASYSTGEIMQCSIEGGAVCLNDDNFPVPCSDYKIKYYCECTVTPTMHPTGISGGVPTVTPPSGKTQNPNLVHGSTTSLQGQVTTGAPVQCSGNWSSWINTDTPDNGDGDRESWTAAQKAAFCPYGKISRIECRTTDDIASYSTGEIMQCSIEGGAVCLNDDNFPVPCSDYKIKYYCECTVHGSTTSLPGQVTTGAPVHCTSNWSSWINTDTPDSGDGDRESWTVAQKAAFCPYGKVSRIECRTIDDIASYSSGEIMQCTIEGGAVCLNDDNFPVPCSDYKIKYYCECTAKPTLPPPVVTGQSPSATTMGLPPTVHHDHTTHTHGGPSIAPCLTRWSRWINRDHPDSGRGDIEKMNAHELNVFCPEGRIKGIECVTVDGIASYSSGEILSCSINNGLECLNDNNFPVPCSDYKIRYHCDCEVTKGPCIPEQCPPMVKPVLKEGEELQTVIDENGCCSKNIVVCKPNLCAPPILNCPAPMSLEPAGGESDCCVTYRCNRYYAIGQDAVEIQTKCNCTSFACMTRILVLPTPGQNTCQYKLADNTTQTYQTGQTWSDGFCTHCACIAKEGVAGIGYKTIARPDQCCGDCQPNGCVVNGTIYKDGATIPTSRKCYDKLCTFDAEIGMFIVSETHVQCPAYEQLTECKANEEAYDATGCCMKCLPERNVTSSSLTCQTCAPRLVVGNPNDTIGYFTIMDNMEVCKNVEPIPDLLECSGFCNSRSSYSHVMQGFTNRCNCCQATGSETRNVQLTCKSGRTITKSYSVPKSCGCNLLQITQTINCERKSVCPNG
ncbi:CRAM-like protein [Mya arenaria]|uniref:CRAM-like protein n=1 Tax=Mya arenaria TaxID=6604 RepID=A0ABY7EKW3_MYAAR|nr:CRAM-like protein [Mya arenaria]